VSAGNEAARARRLHARRLVGAWSALVVALLVGVDQVLVLAFGHAELAWARWALLVAFGAVAVYAAVRLLRDYRPSGGRV